MNETAHGASAPPTTGPTVHANVTVGRLQDAILDDEYTGFCINCGA